MWISGFLQFESVLNESDPREDLRKLVDARLGDNYPIDAAHKVRTQSDWHERGS